ncbi:MAG: AlbA family DNA-binding domain-containing protein [Bryobacteraceae bacterium]
MNLYSCDLETVSIDDIKAFLGLTNDPQYRPEEGTRLELKSEIPNEIGKAVAALANAQGGVMILGVQTAKATGRFTYAVGLPGYERPASEQKTYITNRIITTVWPIPGFDVATRLIAPGRWASVVRVEPGVYPPYEFRASDGPLIPIREQDRIRRASVREIESLLRMRQLAGRPARDFLGFDPDSSPYRAVGPLVHGNADFIDVRIASRSPIRNRLDALVEKAFKRTVGEIFTQRGKACESRSGNHFELSYENADDNARQAWVLGSDGSLGYVRVFERGKTALLGQLIDAIARTILLLRKFDPDRMIFPHPLVFGCALEGSKLTLQVGYVHTGDISHIKPQVITGVGNARTEYIQEDFDEHDPLTATTTALLYLVRDIGGADVAYLALESSVRVICEGIGLLRP